MSNPDWWRGAVIYQIYPRSFQDSNNDGIGDLPGILNRLDYIAGLGVDGIWISPFYPSPMKDFGYDVSNYRDIDPVFGTMDDFDTLIKAAHTRNIKIIIDLVLSHTSDQHPWFQNPEKKDWYVWADGKENGAPPNNWLSVFGGSAWEFDARYGQYYLHNFLKEQPDLNFHNPHVQEEMLDICRFWLDKGVDGFRLDVVNFYFHDRTLTDNPARENVVFATQFEADVPYARQYHIYDKSRPENLEFIKKLRTLTNQYPERFMVGEIGDDDPYGQAQTYTTGDEYLHTAYNTHMMSGTQKELRAQTIVDPINKFTNYQNIQPNTPECWPSWAFSNHDVVRAASRWFNTPFGHDPNLSKMLVALLGCLPGTLFLYQGEELGLPEAEIPFDKIQDPWAKETWPLWQGRDGCRTPMPWDDTKNYCGFSKHEPWLPCPRTHFDLNVRIQNEMENSCLNFSRRFLNWRKNTPALVHGKCEFKATSSSKILDFTRFHNDYETICIFNLSPEPCLYKQQKLLRYEFKIDGFDQD